MKTLRPYLFTLVVGDSLSRPLRPEGFPILVARRMRATAGVACVVP